MDAFSDIKPVPPDVILSWPKPNYTDPDRRGPALLIVNYFLLPLAMVVIGMRLYTRLVIVHSAGLDDVFILTPLLIAAVGLTIEVCLAASQYGWDLHIWGVLEADIIPGRIVTWVAQLLFVAATNLTKLSILLFYTRLSTVGIRTPFDYAVWGTIVFVILYIISFSISVITACNVIIVSTIRAYWVNIIVNVTYDTTWEGFILWILVALEVDVALICASAPTLKPTFRRYFHSHNTHSSSHCALAQIPTCTQECGVNVLVPA
ncbi:hypothetical protein V501_07194 [Pseudogymnoascus sp. VKM F-4519 (FW-2642)]|nr:hypothetical protein V501_07194 [Pseudogymnoascus sp. VKM F-4519 (FW-2642)]